VHPRWNIGIGNPVFVEIAGGAGIIYADIAICYAVQRTILPIIFCSQLAHKAYTHFSFGKTGTFHHLVVLGKTQGGKDA
jgi:hypothetical protein